MSEVKLFKRQAPFWPFLHYVSGVLWSADAFMSGAAVCFVEVIRWRWSE